MHGSDVLGVCGEPRVEALAEALHQQQGGDLVVVEGADLDPAVELFRGVGPLRAEVVDLEEKV